MKKHRVLLCVLALALAAYVQSKPHEKNQHVFKHDQTSEKQRKIFGRMVVTKQFLDPIDNLSRKNDNGSQKYLRTFCCPTFFKKVVFSIFSYYGSQWRLVTSIRTKICIQIWNNSKHKLVSVKPYESKGGILSTFLSFESSTQDPEDEDMSEENESHVELKQTGETERKVSDGGEDNTPLLLSEKALTELLQYSEEAEHLAEDDEDDDNPGEREDKNEGQNKEDDGTDIDSSTDSEIPMDLDASDRDASQPLPIKLKDAKPSTINTLDKKMEKTEDVIPAAMDYDSQQPSSSEDSKEDILEKQSELDMPAERHQTQDELTEPLHDSENDKISMGEMKPGEDEKRDLQDGKDSIPTSGKKAKKEKKQKNESGHGKGKGKKKQKKQNVEDMQNDQASTFEANKEHTQEKQVDPTENPVPKPRKKNGKWSRLFGINPVQIKATMELYPDIRPTHRPSGEGVPADPCENFRCKRGKTCKMNDDNKPTCVCQETSACPPSLNEFDHVCGTDNKTYDTSCQLFTTKCGLEGTKKGHRLHLDYTGSCKFIAPCLEAELVQFPLRMRDWLKNVLLQLYEHDSMSPGFLTAKQRFRVQKIYESERRLHAGDHHIELLLQDFEKNYNMYIYPVHWQFAQMDQHPSDRFLSHSELAPLRVPLVPMEHCTSVFFQKCDDDNDKLVSFREWCSCFGIKEEDMDANLLF